MSSSFGDSAPQGTPVELGGPGGQADCHRSARVEIGGGLTGLLSRMRSISNITPVDSRGRSWGKYSKFVLKVAFKTVNVYVYFRI